MLGVSPFFLVNNVPNINDFGQPSGLTLKEVRGPRGSKGAGSNLANSPEMIYVYVFFFLCFRFLFLLPECECGWLSCYTGGGTAEIVPRESFKALLAMQVIITLRGIFDTVQKSLEATGHTLTEV